MALEFTFKKFPINNELKDECGLPFGCVVRPFHPRPPLSGEPLPSAAGIARCNECFAYASGHCSFTRYGWTCCLCGGYTDYTPRSAYHKTACRRSLPEIKKDLVDLEISREAVTSDSQLGVRPITVALVDLNGGEEFVELVKSALLAALEALPAGSLFGLLTFDRKVGVYDVQGTVPLVKNVPLPLTPDADETLTLDEALPLERLLAPLDKYKESMVAAIETLRPVTPWQLPASTTPQGENGVEEVEGQGQRAFGGALEALLQYLGSEEDENTIPSQRGASQGDGEDPSSMAGSTHVLTFLAGLPDVGPGALHKGRYTPAASKGEGVAAEETETADELMEPYTSFYKDLAMRAAAEGVVIDLCVAGAPYCDLASLQFLATLSGGKLFLYPTLDESTLPQDIYRRLRRPRALGGVLRLRTSVEFTPARAYGHFFPDEQYENLYHVLSCDVHDTFAFDFEFANTGGFSQNYPPMLQLAFQYTVLIPCTSEAEDPTGFILSRRLRIHTVSLEVATSARNLYMSAQSDVILAILQHKIVRASLDEGIAEGRLLLQDWLVILAAHYNEHYGLATFGPGAATAPLDVTFSRCEAMQQIPRLVYALLQSPLLSHTPPNSSQQGPARSHPDRRIHLQTLLAALDPAALLRAIYPVLSSYKTPDQEAFPRHSLSRAALITSGSCIFLLDAYTHLLCYYAPACPSDLPFPPPQSSALRAKINQVRAERAITPHLHFLRGGVDSVELFESHLIEEQDAGLAGAVPGLGFVGFLDTVTTEVRAFMQSG